MMTDEQKLEFFQKWKGEEVELSNNEAFENYIEVKLLQLVYYSNADTFFTTKNSGYYKYARPIQKKEMLMKPEELCDKWIVWGVGQVDASESTNEDNNESIIPLQHSQLTALSTQSRGRLVLITHDKQDVNQVNQYIENNLVVVEDESRPWHDASYPLVFVIAALFLFWFRRGWTLQW